MKSAPRDSSSKGFPGGEKRSRKCEKAYRWKTVTRNVLLKCSVNESWGSKNLSWKNLEGAVLNCVSGCPLQNNYKCLHVKLFFYYHPASCLEQISIMMVIRNNVWRAVGCNKICCPNGGELERTCSLWNKESSALVLVRLDVFQEGSLICF